MLNSQYTFDPVYMKCVSDNMDDLQPFGDVPRKLASSVKRSLVGARALVRALKTGHDIANVLTRVSFDHFEINFCIYIGKSIFRTRKIGFNCIIMLVMSKIEVIYILYNKYLFSLN